MATYNLFISHAWHRNEHYNRIVEWLDNSIILWRNYSVPEHDPLDANNASKLKAALTESKYDMQVQLSYLLECMQIIVVGLIMK